MAVERSVFKERTFECCACGIQFKHLGWDKDPNPTCACGGASEGVAFSRGDAAAVHGDEIDIVIRHGPVNDDGSPRRYRSRTELKRESQRKGWVPLGDTPKSNPNPWF
jgi:hypothetical protein